MSTIVFAHANSFGASTYRVLLQQLRERGYAVEAIDQLGHDARYPVTNNWTLLVQQLAEFAAGTAERTGQPVWLVGHSLGGYLSVMVAALHPHLVRGVVLLDAPVLGGWRAIALKLLKRTRLVSQVSPAAVSRRRRNTWPSVDDVLAHFQSKKVFARWDADVLRDYAQHGTRDHAGQRVLAFSREVETQVYNTLPDNVQTLLRRRPLQCPVAFIGGRSSEEMRRVGMGLTAQVTQGRILMVDGGHLFPMERPSVTASAIDTALRNMAH